MENYKKKLLHLVTCPAEESEKGDRKSSSVVLKVVVGLILAGILCSALIMLFLTLKDRNYAKGAKRYA